MIAGWSRPTGRGELDRGALKVERFARNAAGLHGANSIVHAVKLPTHDTQTNLQEKVSRVGSGAETRGRSSVACSAPLKWTRLDFAESPATTCVGNVFEVNTRFSVGRRPELEKALPIARAAAMSFNSRGTQHRGTRIYV